MSAESLLASGRMAAERLMVDTCTVRHPDTEGTDLDSSGNVTTVPGSLVYAGKFKIQFADNIERETPAGGHVFVEQRYQLHFPVSAPRIVEGLVVEVTASAISPHNVGRLFRVAGPGEKTFTTAQRVVGVEVVDRLADV